jgi:hypothetical protein
MVTRNPPVPGAKYLPLGHESHSAELAALIARMREIRP